MAAMIIFCGGMRSSGSTLQWQIAKHLVEATGLGIGYIKNRGRKLDWNTNQWQVVKSHKPPQTIKDNAKVLITIRDPRDIVSSLMLRNKVSFQIALGQLAYHMKDLQAWLAVPINSYLRKYENFINDLEMECQHIASFLKIPVNRNLKQQIATTYSLGKNKRRPRFSSIGNGKIGKYSGFLTLKQVAKVELHFTNWMANYGYL